MQRNFVDGRLDSFDEGFPSKSPFRKGGFGGIFPKTTSTLFDRRGHFQGKPPEIVETPPTEGPASPSSDFGFLRRLLPAAYRLLSAVAVLRGHRKTCARMLAVAWLCLPMAFLAVALPGASLADASPADMTETVERACQAGLPREVLTRLLSQGYEGGVAAEHMARWIDFLREVHEEGLPWAPFSDKIQEGLAKRVPPPLVFNVLEKKRSDYRFVRDALKESPAGGGASAKAAGEPLAFLAESLGWGLSREEVKEILHGAPSPDALGETAQVWAVLKQLRFDEAGTRRLVFTGMEEGYFVPSNAGLSRVFGAARRKGVPESRIVEAALEAMKRRQSPEALSRTLGLSESDLSFGPRVGRRGQGAGARRGRDGGQERGAGRGMGHSGGGEHGGRSGGSHDGGGDGSRGEGPGHGDGGPGNGGRGGGGRGK